ncbi:MAG: VOC family protein [Oscillospiraceae bacterium]|nr:VOC family protein [Oscillospiraceae bacterium]
MKVLCIDHIAVGVDNIAEAEANFKRIGCIPLLTNHRDDTKYTVEYTAWGESCLTLVQPDDETCFVYKDMTRRGGQGLHHMGIEVEDINEAEKFFVENGGKVGPKETIEGVRTEFVVAPKNNSGVLVQVMQFFPPYAGKTPAERYAMLAKDGKLHHG